MAIHSSDGDAFLQYDSHDEQDLGDKEKRILLFGSNQNLGYLANSPSVYLDGTFSICPKLFFQLYLFVGIVNGTFLPLAFALLTGKTKDIYTEHCVNVSWSLDLRFDSSEYHWTLNALPLWL